MTTWRRLRIIEVEHSDADELLSVAEALRRIDKPVESLRKRAACWLERLAKNEKALTAITSTGAGRPRTTKGQYIALDYLVQKELLGKAAAAEANVAAAWGVRPKTVKDAWTNWQTFARAKLDALTKHREDRPRRALLEDISADLRDDHAKRGREK